MTVAMDHKMEWVAQDFNLRFLFDDANRSSLRQHEDGRMECIRPRLGAAPLVPEQPPASLGVWKIELRMLHAAMVITRFVRHVHHALLLVL